MSTAKISSADGGSKVSSAGTTKKNTEGQMNEREEEEEVTTGKVEESGEKNPITKLEALWE